jgi:CHAT domain-containing protein
MCPADDGLSTPPDVEGSTTSEDDEGHGNDVFGASEVSRHLEYVTRAIEAPDDAARDAALDEALVTFGPRFIGTISQLQSMAEDSHWDDPPWEELLDATVNRLGVWLDGEQISDRVDEPDRRAVAASQLLERSAAGAPSRLIATAILSLPEGDPLRDVSRARALLEDLRALPDSEVDPDSLVLTLARLVDLVEVDELAELEAQAAGIFARAEASNVEKFHLAMAGRAIGEAILRRDAGDEAGRRQWVERAESHADALDTASVGSLMMLALAMDQAENYARAGELYDQARRHRDASPLQVRLATVYGARMRLANGEAAPVVELLAPEMDHLVQRYGEAIRAQDADGCGTELADAGKNLAVAYIRLGRWADAVVTFDKIKSTRFRFRQALRATEAGRNLLALERQILDAQRGLPVELPPGVVDPADRLGADVPRLSTLLESYREDRPPLDPEILRSPSVAELAAVLDPHEAALVLGLTGEGTAMAVVWPDSGETPGAALLEPSLTTTVWLQVLAGEADDGWLFALGAPEADLDRPAALRALVKSADGLLSSAVRQLFGDTLPPRLCIVPHELLHLVPFHALPAFGETVVTTVPSAAQLIHDRNKEPRRLRGRAVVVVDPTRDLPFSVVELQSTRRFAQELELPLAEVRQQAATEPGVVSAVRNAELVHVSGHGQSDITSPDDSALLLAPPEHFDADAFAKWHHAAQSWEELDDENRQARVPGIGVLHERRLLDGAWIEWTMDLPDRCTMWAYERDGRRRAVAERWSAGDLLVDDALSDCVLAVLSACESAVGGMGIGIDEQSGLPAALSLGGADTVVATQWPVDEGVAALTVDMLYQELGATAGLVDMFALVDGVRKRLRLMDRAEAAQRVGALRREAQDPHVRIRLEALARRLEGGAERPFSEPWDWAAFAVTGRGALALGGVER